MPRAARCDGGGAEPGADIDVEFADDVRSARESVDLDEPAWPAD
ncbi:hypothetical protein [Agromyces endophyticus]|nr:hypothetical protein [Agromyces sp. H17E-10]